MKYLLLFVILTLCCVTQADIVYLTNGSEIEGIAVQNGDRIIVKTPDGETKSFSESDVLYIAKGKLREKPAQTPATEPAETSPETKPADTPKPKSPATAPAAKPKEKSDDKLDPVEMDSSEEKQGKLSQCAQSPADMLFGYLRRKISDPTPGIEDLINMARVRLHDRMYKIGPDWVKPEDFQRRRNAFEEKLAEVQGLYKDAAKLSDKDEKESAQKKTVTKNAQVKLAQAATGWLDPLTRWFLIGVSAYNAQDYPKAIQYFHRCVAQAPWVAAFWQGLGDSLMAANRHEDAMYPYIMMLQITDEKNIAVNILRDALAKTPGTKVTAKPVMDAKKFVDLYASVKPSRGSSSQRQAAWLLPGKPVSSKPETLPLPDFDKFTFRQGVAVPVAPQAMLVGADVVKDADTVIVRLREWLYVTAKVETLKNEQIAILRLLTNVQLTPIKITSKNSLKRGQMLTVIATDISPAMSMDVRDASVNVKDIDSSGIITLTGGLLAGEGTSPALDSSGELAGFLIGKLDTDKDTLPDRLIAMSPQSPIAKKLIRASKQPKNRSNPSGGMTIEGQTFVVFAVGTEKLEKK